MKATVLSRSPRVIDFLCPWVSRVRFWTNAPRPIHVRRCVPKVIRRDIGV